MRSTREGSTLSPLSRVDSPTPALYTLLALRIEASPAAGKVLLQVTGIFLEGCLTDRSRAVGQGRYVVSVARKS